MIEEPRTANWSVKRTFFCGTDGCGEWLEFSSKRAEEMIRCPKCRAEWDVICKLSIADGGHRAVRSN